MDADQVAALRAILSNTGWLERAGIFGRALRTSVRTPGGLLVVGTPAEEPWHLTAHLDEESRLSGIAELTPTLVRWSPPPGAPAHLSVSVSRLEEARRGETLFVVAPDAAPAPLLERVNDARHAGATILALDQGDPELDDLAHEYLTIPAAGSAGAGQPPAALDPRRSGPRTFSPRTFDQAELASRTGLLTFDAAQHLVSAAAGDRRSPAPSRGVRSLRGKLARFLDAVSGPSAR
ncbi:MAG TPA: hypothetical protein VG142_15175 [Trebonia sp.]|jgi:hypothetical protein|nr:hypothetical protein [Trebonia sp.]